MGGREVGAYLLVGVEDFSLRHGRGEGRCFFLVFLVHFY